jgi:uncharacterized membrane protein
VERRWIMEDQNIKSYQLIIGMGLVLAGILIFSFLPDPIRFFGFAFIIAAAIYFAYSSTAKTSRRNNIGHYRSRTRDEMLRHHHRVK